MPQTPNTTTQLSHGMSISANRQTIGAINEFNTRVNRNIQELYEFGQVTAYAQGGGPGDPFELVPGNVTGMQIDMRRYDLYPLELERAFGTPDLAMLSGQLDAIDDIKEAWVVPDGPGYIRQYQGCWFSDIGRQISASNDRTINASGTIKFARRGQRIPISS